MKIVKVSLSILLVFTTCVVVSAQDSIRTRYKQGHIFDLALSASGEEFTGAAEWSHLHGLGRKKRRFKVGYGIRYTTYFGVRRNYTTAPSIYTSPVQGPTTIFSETIEENIDTLVFSNPNVTSLNLAIHLEYAFLLKLDVGFNIDAIGFSFGKERQGAVISSVYDAGQSPVAKAKPTNVNILLTSDNDIGSLNSEFYVGYWISKKIRIRGGYTFYFSEYTTENNLSFDNARIQNDRYRFKTGLLMLAVSWKPFN